MGPASGADPWGGSIPRAPLLPRQKPTKMKLFGLRAVRFQNRQNEIPTSTGESEWYFVASSPPKTTPMLHGARFFVFVAFCVFFDFPNSPLKRKLSSADCSILPHISNTFFGILVLMLGIIDHFNSHAGWRSLFSCFLSFLDLDLSRVHFSRKTVQREYQWGNAFFYSFGLPAGHPGTIEFARRFPSKFGFGWPFFLFFFSCESLCFLGVT